MTGDLDDLSPGSLVTLPPEVLGIGCESLDQRSLNALTQTCTTLISIAPPKLYNLSYLERLFAGPGYPRSNPRMTWIQSNPFSDGFTNREVRI